MAVTGVVLVGFATVRADATRVLRAPFQGPEATRARENLRKVLEPRAIVITSEDMGRPAENVEYYGGFPAFYLTDLERWKIKPSAAVLSFISAGMRPYLLLIDRVPRRTDTQDIAAEVMGRTFARWSRVELLPHRRAWVARLYWLDE